jgi:hypothetical protein
MSSHSVARCTALALFLALWIAACGGKSAPPAPTAPSRTSTVNPDTPTGGPPPPDTTTPEPGPTNPAPPPVGFGTASIAAIGDIGWCGSPGMARTARLLRSLSGIVILAGDLAYMRGRTEDFANCFEPDFGQFRARWRPVPGNHEYEDRDANGYFTYFGGAAGPTRDGWYSFHAGAWQVLMLNSEQPAHGGVIEERTSSQYLWARQELRTNPSRCTMAVWHRPFASSGPNGPTPYMRDMWQLLIDNQAELVISAHDHFYERFGPMNAAYQPSERGVRQFIAGSGGAPLYRAVGRFPNSARIVEAFGVLKMTLHAGSYDWEFIDATTSTVQDSGQAQCH